VGEGEGLMMVLVLILILIGMLKFSNNLIQIAPYEIIKLGKTDKLN